MGLGKRTRFVQQDRLQSFLSGLLSVIASVMAKPREYETAGGGHIRRCQIKQARRYTTRHTPIALSARFLE